ncbi:MAG TPA: hypothetical protein PKN85_01525 [Syntrophorhabdaceae bacterium]|nr:hypothetical protein [Syntrophorhabdaceae bacterium]
MNGSIGELTAVLVIVGAVVVLAARSVYRLVTGGEAGKCCGCSPCSCRDDSKETR